MFKNLLTTSLRNIKKNISYALINALGLSVGMACCIATYVIIDFEKSFDDWHPKKDRLFRYVNVYKAQTDTYKNAAVPYPTGDALRSSIPELKTVVDFHGPLDYIVSYTDAKGHLNVYRENVLVTDEGFFEIFDFKVLSGNPASLKEPNKAFLAQSLSEKYFPDQNPQGEYLHFEIDGEVVQIEVAGIVEDPPKNTNSPYGFLLSMPTLRQRHPTIFTTWTMTWAYSTIVEVQEGVDIPALEKKLDLAIDAARNASKERSEKTSVWLQPLLDVHTNENIGGTNTYILPSLLIQSFVLLALLILGTGCLNFINLSTALAIRRSKEIGIRKVLGSSRGMLMGQFLVETFLITFAALLIALSVSPFLLDQFSTFLPADYELLLSGKLVFMTMAIIVGVTLAAGFYPALILSGYQPIAAIKNKISLQKGTGSFNLRKGLIIAQFTFTSVMIVSTLIISAQIDHLKSKDLGFDWDGVFMIQTPEHSEVNPRAFLNELKTKRFVADATLSFTPPSAWWNQSASYELKGATQQNENQNANFKFIDEAYLSFYNIPLIAGRNIKEQYINDSTFQAVVSQNLTTSLGFKTPEEALGKSLTVGGEGHTYKIVGVTQDFSTSSAHNEYYPVIFSHNPDRMRNVAVKLPDENISDYLAEIEAAYRMFYPEDLFEHSLLSKEMNSRYDNENALQLAIHFVSVMAILLAVIGLYGLVSFMATRSAKSIGIRKVFGASVLHIMGKFTLEYFVLLVVSFVLSTPIVLYLMGTWMQNFSSRIQIGPLFFLTGFAFSLLIALLTVGYRSWIAASANPTRSLRNE